MRLAAIAGLTVSTAARRTSATLIARASSRSLPLIARDTSSRSSMRRVCACAFRSIAAIARACCGGSIVLRAEHARPAVDRRERRAQLVRHGHQELVLQVARGLGLFPRALLALERAPRAARSRRAAARLRAPAPRRARARRAPRVDRRGRAPAPSPPASASARRRPRPSRAAAAASLPARRPRSATRRRRRAAGRSSGRR